MVIVKNHHNGGKKLITKFTKKNLSYNEIGLLGTIGFEVTIPPCQSDEVVISKGL